MKNLKISLLYEFYGSVLSDTQKNVIEMYYNEDLSLSEIAEHAGISRQGVRDSIVRAEEHLLFLEEKLGLYEKSVQNRRLQEHMLRLLNELQNVSDKEEAAALLQQLKETVQKLDESK